MRNRPWLLAALTVACGSNDHPATRDARAVDAPSAAVDAGPPIQTSDEALLELDQIRSAAIRYFNANGSFPQATSSELPTAAGSACSGAGGKMAVTNTWNFDAAWKALGFSIGLPTLFSVWYNPPWLPSSTTTATAIAIGDLDCDTTLITYTLTLSTDVSNHPIGVITEPPPGTD